MAPEAISAAKTAKPTMKQLLVAAGVADGLSIAEAGRQAGVAHRQSAYEMFRNLRERLLTDFDAVGISTRTIALKIKEKLDAKETKLCSGDVVMPDGHVRKVFTDAVDLEAHSVQLEAAKLAADIMGLTNDKASTSIGTVNVLFANALPDWCERNTESNGGTGTSTIEGTEPRPGAYTHTNSGQIVGSSCDSAVPVQAVPAKGKLSQRIVKKRRPRLPVYRGPK